MSTCSGSGSGSRQTEGASASGQGGGKSTQKVVPGITINKVGAGDYQQKQTSQVVRPYPRTIPGTSQKSTGSADPVHIDKQKTESGSSQTRQDPGGTYTGTGTGSSQTSSYGGDTQQKQGGPVTRSVQDTAPGSSQDCPGCGSGVGFTRTTSAQSGTIVKNEQTSSVEQTVTAQGQSQQAEAPLPSRHAEAEIPSQKAHGSGSAWGQGGVGTSPQTGGTETPFRGLLTVTRPPAATPKKVLKRTLLI